MGAYFVLITRVLINVGRYQNRVTLFARWQWNRSLNLSSGALCRIDDFFGRHINQAMIKSFQANADTLILHGLTPPNLFTPKRPHFA